MEAFPEDDCINPAAAGIKPLADEDTTEQSLDDEGCESHLECAVGEHCSAGACLDVTAGAPDGARCSENTDCAAGHCLDVDGLYCDADGGVQCTCSTSGAPGASAPPPAPCVNKAPSFSINTAQRKGDPGATVWFKITMTSHDTGSCGGRLLQIQLDLPGAQWSFQPVRSRWRRVRPRTSR